ncbi:MAG TPA: FtsH protease activity modulator HflK [Thermodesulforhabdus norvegica]|uniref:Protein HflK n=1 Tax=Thermodesulforhabdus norvegica TaxID=39841 RepID=A0A7C1AL29_9BACT|nr:FtsH protease activity modulator HflK [Deltaproteobacteria bacterium]MBW2068883.1 FtsH protease activity modulator HflK [Deltaproteobacteria bacterium]HDL89507.1 FtsH protease activity modulator HflK [Thermodesulforhabdus norvegica]
MTWEPQRPQRQVQLGIEEFFRKVSEAFKSRRPASRGPFWIVPVVVLLILAGLNSYYIVNPQETAVVTRFGRFVRTADAGFHLKWPFGIERVQKVVTGRILQREYGYRTIRAGVRSRFAEKGFEEEARMLSGDLNVVDVQWTVQYKIADPVKYLFRVRDVESTLDDISESVMRRMVGNRYADEVLTVGRAEIAELVRKELQAIMDHYETGLQIVTVKLQNVNPPDPVKAAFNEVNEARQEKERMINEAQEMYNQQIPRARGQAQQMITEAEGYALERVNRAQGDTQRFLRILAEYQKAPDITKKRMYLEAFEQFLRNIKGVVVLDENQTGNVLNFLDIGKVMKVEKVKDLQSEPGSKLHRKAHQTEIQK